MPVGRWSLLRPVWTQESTAGAPQHRDEAMADNCCVVAVWCSANCWRATQMPPWRTLLPSTVVEARGEIRGGRFVAGFIGEQFALPEAVDGLRAVRRQSKSSDTVIITAADPLNLVGILHPVRACHPSHNRSSCTLRGTG